MPVTILHTNDLHGTMIDAMADRVREAKDREHALYFDSGDLIKAGNLAIPLKPDPAWPLIHRAGCDAGTIGNRETHVLEAAFRAKLEGSSHPLVCANLFRRDGTLFQQESITFEKAGVRIAVFGVMVPMVTRKMATQAASAFLWEAPIPIARQVAERLRPNCDLLVALTHIGHGEDLKLAESAPMIDLILGGHSHTVLSDPVRIGTTWICQGGSHGRFIGRYVWDGGMKEAELLPLTGA